MSGPRAGAGRHRRRGALALALATALGCGLPGSAAALVGDLDEGGIREAIETGIASITQDDFAEEWQLRLPGGEEVVVTTPFSRLALAARNATMKGEALTEKQQKEQIDRSKGRIQLLVTMRGGPPRNFARFYQPVLVVDGREVNTLGPGDHLGEIAAIDWGRDFSYGRTANVVAVDDATLAAFPAAALRELMTDVPEIDRAVRRIAQARLTTR